MSCAICDAAARSLHGEADASARAAADLRATKPLIDSPEAKMAAHHLAREQLYRNCAEAARCRGCA